MNKPKGLQKWSTYFSRFWAYMGGLSAMALMAGAIGMGSYHITHDNENDTYSELYEGFYNSADETMPRGIGALPLQMTPTHSHMRFEYDAQERLRRVVHVNNAGHRSNIPGSRVAEQTLRYNKAGQLISKSNRNAQGLPSADSAGVAERRFRYDEKGRLIESSFHNTQGQAIVPLMPGFAYKRTQYDAQNRPILIEYLDGHQKPLINARGESRISFEYDDELGSRTRRNEINGMLSNNKRGFAIERHLVSNGGRMQRTEWLDASGSLALNRGSDCAIIQIEFDEKGNRLRSLFLNEKGQLLQTPRTPAEHLARHNKEGLIEWESYNAADGLPCKNSSLGFAERMCEYNQDKRLVRENFWNEHGLPSRCYEKRYARSPQGTHEISLHTDGSTQTRLVRN